MKIMLVIEGGCVQEILSDELMPNWLQITITDLDNEPDDAPDRTVYKHDWLWDMHGYSPVCE